MLSPPALLEPPSKPPDWLVPVLLGLAVIALVLLLVFVGWPMIALLLFALVFGGGVYVGYKGRENEDFQRHVRRWLE